VNHDSGLRKASEKENKLEKVADMSWGGDAHRPEGGFYANGEIGAEQSRKMW